jgi:hypothetical protein
MTASTDFDRYRHEMTMRVSLEAAVEYIATESALSETQIRTRLLDAVRQAHTMADRTCPLPHDGAVAA